MAYFGKSFRLNRYADPTYYAIGKVKDASPRTSSRTAIEVATEKRKPDKDIVETIAGLDFTLALQRFDYLTEYCIISGEGTVPLHKLRYTDGLEKGEFSDCKVNTCRVSITRERLEAAISVVAGGYADGTWAPNWQSFPEKPMTFKSVKTLNFGTYDFSWKFKEIEFGVDNKVIAEYYGTGTLPSDIGEQEARYSGHCVFPRRGETSRMVATIMGEEIDIVIALQSNQVSPVTKTFTFNDCSLKLSRIDARGLGLELERVEWEPNSLTIT